MLVCLYYAVPSTPCVGTQYSRWASCAWVLRKTNFQVRQQADLQNKETDLARYTAVMEAHKKMSI